METGLDPEALAAALTPVDRYNVTELVVDRLRALLEKGILKPGSKLPTELQMTKLLGISRPSLRQAYKALNILGIIRAVPGDGTYISESTSRMLSTPLTFLMLMKKIGLDDIFEFRMLLEGELATLAAARASEEESKAMDAQLRTMEAHMDDDQREQYFKAEYEFHNCIAGGAHNILLLEIISIVGGMLWETRKRLVNLVADLSEDLQEHREIYLAIRARDPQGARGAMQHHLQSALELVKKDASTLSKLTRESISNQ